MKMKFIKDNESFDWVRERMENYQHIFECLALASERIQGLLDKIEATQGSIKAEKLKAKVYDSLRSFTWDFDDLFVDSYEDELAFTRELVDKAFGKVEEEVLIPDFAPPVD